MVSMTGYWNAYKLDIPIQWLMTMVITKSSERKPPSMPPSQAEAHTMIGDFTEITVSNSDDDLHLVRVMSARLNGPMADLPEVEIWRTVSLWMSLLSFYFSSVYFFTPLDLGQLQMASARVLPSPETSQVAVEFPRAPDQPNDYHMVLIGCGTYWFVRLHTLNGCFIVSYLQLYRFMQPRRCPPKEGDNVTARLHFTGPGPGNISVIYSRLATSLRSLAIILHTLTTFINTHLRQHTTPPFSFAKTDFIQSSLTSRENFCFGFQLNELQSPRS